MIRRFYIVLSLIALAIQAPAQSKAPAPTPRQLADGGARILDVRTPREFQSGHLQGAINVPVDSIEKQISQVSTNKADALLIHCQSGGRSASAARKLRQLGYTNVIDLGGLDKARKATGR